MRKGILTFVGVICVGLGTAGIILPLLPTTPFLLLAAACFVRSSDKLYNWLSTHKWFGQYITNYRDHRKIAKRTKITILIMLWMTLSYTVVFEINNAIFRVLLVLIGIGVTIYIMSLKTLSTNHK